MAGVRYLGHADEHYIAMLKQCSCYGLTGGSYSHEPNDATRDGQYTYVQRGADKVLGLSDWHIMHTNLGFVRGDR